jgi:hypothetical protein
MLFCATLIHTDLKFQFNQLKIYPDTIKLLSKKYLPPHPNRFNTLSILFFLRSTIHILIKCKHILNFSKQDRKNQPFTNVKAALHVSGLVVFPVAPLPV